MPNNTGGFGDVVSTHSRAEAAAINDPQFSYLSSVSTHSRAEAAAAFKLQAAGNIDSFNTQPHEGGCTLFTFNIIFDKCFNTQPHEGGCTTRFTTVSKAGCFNTQPHEGGCTKILTHLQRI